MADTSISITAGSGTSIDTRTEATNGNHRQVVVIGDPSTNAGVAPVDVTAGLKVDLGADNDVTVSSSALPTGASTSAKQDTQITAEQAIQTSVELIDDAIKADDAAFTPATTKVMMAGFMVDDTATDSVDEGDAGSARMSADRIIYTQSAVAHDAADSGNPTKVGGKALTAQPTAVAANDRVNAMFDVYGRQVTINSLREMKGNQITTITSSTSETTCVTADATYKLDVYAVFVTNTSATATEVSFKDSTSGTTRFTLSVPANDMRGFCLPMDAGHVQNAANNNWTATCADSVASIIITVLFVKNL